MTGVLDLKGQKFGRLTVIVRAGSNKDGAALWHCECSRGGFVKVPGVLLRSGNTRSCGCLRRDAARKNSYDYLRVKLRGLL